MMTVPWIVAIFHFETFVNFDFDLSLISRLITDSDLDQIKCFLDMTWWTIGQQNYKKKYLKYVNKYMSINCTMYRLAARKR